MPPYDLSGKPSAARIYNFWLGGYDNSAADRELADRMTDPAQGGYPGLRDLARENRRFVLAAVQRLAGIDGIAQFIDLGSGVPNSPSIHQVARSAIPDATVAFVDTDPLAVSHTGRLEGEGIAVLDGDLADPETVLADPALLKVVDLDGPVCVVFGAVLQYWPAEKARAIVAGYAEAMAPGSAAVISVVSFADNQVMAGRRRMMPSPGFFNHDMDAVASFFGDLRVMRGPVGDVQRWPFAADEDERAARVIGGVRIKGG